ncbi:MAG: hypothetical protein FWD48_03865 [Oscillospiraceae bacterium]|nr:hypothetical protein [Oscillospiraceae bacterium]
MKNLKNKKLLTGAAAVLVIGFVVTLLFVLTPEEPPLLPPIDNQAEDNAALEAPAVPEPEEPEADTVQTEPDETEDLPVAQPQTPPPAVTTTPTPEVVEIVLAPAETFTEEVVAIIAEHDIQYIENPQIEQTIPTAEEQQAPDTTTIIDGREYIWHPILGWVETGREGNVTVMDVECDGYYFFQEADGTVSLDKIVTPNGNVISLDEYQKIRESR